MTNDAGAGELIEAIQNARVEETDLENYSGPIDGDISSEPSGARPDDARADVDGAIFDGSIHCADASGNPVVTKLGRFRKKATGGASKSEAPKTAQARPNTARPKPRLNLGNDSASRQDFSTETGAPSDGISAKMKMAAETAAEIYIQTGVCFFGHEWLPAPDMSDRAGLVHAFAQYFSVKGIEDVPPGIALAIAMFGYAAPRFYRPQTANRLKLIWSWFRVKMDGLKNRASRANSGTNGVRENPSGEASGQEGSRGWLARIGS